MLNGMCWVGLDVHAHATAVAVFDDATGEVITRRVNGRPMAEYSELERAVSAWVLKSSTPHYSTSSV